MLLSWFRRRDEYEDNLRRASTRLQRYASELHREASELDRSAGDIRSRELASSRASAAARLALLHSWGLSSLLPTFFEQATLVVRRAYVRAAADAAAVGALVDTAAAAASWSRHLSRLADERAADERAILASTGSRSTSSTTSQALPLDVDAFCALPAAILAASAPLARVRSRETRLTERLLLLDAEIRTLAPALAPPVGSARTAALAAASAAAAADAAAAVAAESAATAAVAAAGEGVLHPAAVFLFPLAAARSSALLAAPLTARRDALRSLLILGELEEYTDNDDDDDNDNDDKGAKALLPLPFLFFDAWSRLSPDAARHVDIAVDGFSALLSNAAARRLGHRLREDTAERILGDQRFKEGRLLQAWATRVLVPEKGHFYGINNAAAAPPIFARDLPRYICSMESASRPAFDGGDGFYLAVLRGAGVGAALAGVARAADDDSPQNDRKYRPIVVREIEEGGGEGEGERENGDGATSPAASSAGAYENLLSPSVGPLSPKVPHTTNTITTTSTATASTTTFRPRTGSGVLTSAVAPEISPTTNNDISPQQLPNARGVAAFCSHFSKETAREHFPGASALTSPHAAALAALTEGVVFSRIRAVIFRGIDLIPSEVLRAPVVAPRLPKASAAYGGAGAIAASAATVAAGDGLTLTPPPKRSAARAAAFAPPASPADLVNRRDRIWVAKAPLVYAKSLEELGLPIQCAARLPVEEGNVEDDGTSDTRKNRPYVPFRAASSLLALIETEADPRAMAAIVVRAVDAAVAEACARAATAAPPGAKPRQLSAEELIPLIVTIATQARLRRPHAAIAYMAAYGLGGVGGGRADYCVCTLQLAVAWTCTQRAVRVAGGVNNNTVLGGGKLGEPRQAATDICAVRRVAGTPGKAGPVDNDYFDVTAAVSPLKLKQQQQHITPLTRERSTNFDEGTRTAFDSIDVTGGATSIGTATATTDDILAADERAYGAFADTLLLSGGGGSGGSKTKSNIERNESTTSAECGDGGGSEMTVSPLIMTLASFAAALGDADDDSTTTTISTASITNTAMTDTNTSTETSVVELCGGVDDIISAADDADVASAELYASLALGNDSNNNNNNSSISSLPRAANTSARNSGNNNVMAAPSSSSAGKRFIDAIRRGVPPRQTAAPPSSSDKSNTAANHISALRELVAEQDALEGALAVLD